MTEGLVAEVAGVLVASFCAYLFYRFKKLEERMTKAMSKEDIKELIGYHVDPIKEEQVDIKKDLNKLSEKIDANHEKVNDKLDKLLLKD